MANVQASCTIHASMTAGGRDKVIYMLILRRTLDFLTEFTEPYEALRQ
jgi:hypothetical protein